MKKYLFIVLISIGTFVSCQQKENTACEDFKFSLINMDKEFVGTYVNSFCADLQANVSVDDPAGHEQNTNILIQRIKNDCDVIVDLLSYATIETFPTQSELSISVIENQDTITRIIDLLNDPEGKLSFANMHE
jgi:hypothetical protein